MVRRLLVPLALAMIGLSACDGEAHRFTDRWSGEDSDPESERFLRFQLVSDIDEATRVFLKIPSRFAGDKETLRPTSSYYFLITSTDLKGMFEEVNYGQAHCAGYCRGRTTVSLEISPKRKIIQPELFEYISDTEKYDLVSIGDFASIHEEYDVMWREYPYKPWRAVEKSPVPAVSPQDGPERPAPLPPLEIPPEGYDHEERYNRYKESPWPAAHIVVFRNEDGDPDIVECSARFTKDGALITDRGPVPLCEFTGRSKKNPDLLMNLNFHYRDLARWPKLRDEMFDLVDSFIE